MYTSARNGPCKRHKVGMLRTANNEYSSLSRLFDVCTAAVFRVLLKYRIARDPKGKRQQRIGGKQKIDSQIHVYSLTSEVEKACREKRRVRSEGQLSFRSTPSVEWPRYVERGRRVRCWLGWQLLFFWGGFSCCINPQMSERKWSGHCRVSLWGHDSRSSALLASFRHFSARRGNTRIPYSWNVPLVPDYKNIIHCHGISDKA